MKSLTLTHPDGRQARVVVPLAHSGGTTIAAALQLPPFRGLLLLNGGASEMPAAETARLTGLFQAVAELSAAESIALIDGGTATGVMQLMGTAWARANNPTPLIGVCPAMKINWPGRENAPERARLDLHHTHFVLTPGQTWGTETRMMFALAGALSQSVPSLALIANGGTITRRELLANMHQGREMIAIAGSGRLADQIVAILRDELLPRPDPGLVRLVRQGRITVFDEEAGPKALAAVLRTRLNL